MCNRQFGPPNWGAYEVRAVPDQRSKLSTAVNNDSCYRGCQLQQTKHEMDTLKMIKVLYNTLDKSATTYQIF